jgi:hypothetical protein
MTNDAVLKLEFLVTVAVRRLGVLRSSESDSWTPHWQVSRRPSGGPGRVPWPGRRETQALSGRHLQVEPWYPMISYMI